MPAVFMFFGPNRMPSQSQCGDATGNRRDRDADFLANMGVEYPPCRIRPRTVSSRRSISKERSNGISGVLLLGHYLSSGDRLVKPGGHILKGFAACGDSLLWQKRNTEKREGGGGIGGGNWGLWSRPQMEAGAGDIHPCTPAKRPDSRQAWLRVSVSPLHCKALLERHVGLRGSMSGHAGVV